MRLSPETEKVGLYAQDMKGSAARFDVRTDFIRRAMQGEHKPLLLAAAFQLLNYEEVVGKGASDDGRTVGDVLLDLKEKEKLFIREV